MTAMNSVLTIGNFDGVHRGHRALVEGMLDWRRQQYAPSTLKSVVVTFEPHPIEVLRPGVVVPRLSTPREKLHLLQNLGIDEVVVIPFTVEFSQMSAKHFFDEVLIKRFNPTYVSIGHNFYFGHKKEGTPGQLLEWCAQANITAHLFDPVQADGSAISSSRIRKLIQDGQMNAASRLLGRNYAIEGEVVHGNKRGRTIGFPTANVLPELRCVPATGVYLSSATVEGKTFPSITNVGYKPTVQDRGPLIIETHILDQNPTESTAGTGSMDLYGKQLTVEFKDRIRPEQKFSSLDQLKEQIRKDTDFARAQLRHNWTSI